MAASSDAPGAPGPRPGGSRVDPFAAYEVARPVVDGRPWLMANMVSGVDGSLAWHGRVGTLSSEADRSLFVRLRAVADAVLVGAGTVRAEGYGPVRLPADRRAERTSAGRREVPPLVVVSRSLDLDWEGPLWHAGAGTVVVTCSAAPGDRMREAHARAEVVVAGDDLVDLGAALAALSERGVRVVLTEGGPTLLDELVAAGLLDELCLTITPQFGGDPLTMAHRRAALARLTPFALAGSILQDDEVYLRYLVQRAEQPEEG